MMKLEDLNTPYKPTWCPGCGNFGIWAAFKNAAVEKDWNNYNTVIVADIGCHGHIMNFVKLSSIEGLHGRAIPTATGVKLANHKLNVFVNIGDGGCLGEGGNHFIHACRRNHDITVLLHDNAIYALTTGQTSPASPYGFESKSTPEGNPDYPIFPCALAIAAGATFVARGYAGDINGLKELIIKANEHKGISIVDILQPCVTFNPLCTHEFFQENTYHLGDEYDPSDKMKALEISYEWREKKIALGIIYETNIPSYESNLVQIKEKPLVEQIVEAKNLDTLLKKYT